MRTYLCLVVATLATAATAGPAVNLIDLGAGFTSFNDVYANESGDIAFNGSGPNNHRAFVVRQGAVSPIAFEPIPPAQGVASRQPFVLGIADAGHVVVQRDVEINGDAFRQIYRYSDASNISVLTQVADPNNQIDGVAGRAGHALFYSRYDDPNIIIQAHRVDPAGNLENLGPGPVFVSGMNRLGHAVGQAYIDRGLSSRAYVLDDGGAFRTIPLDAPSIGGDINDLGVATGRVSLSPDGSTRHFFLWDTATDATTPIEQPEWAATISARTITNDNIVGGSIGIEGDAEGVAFVWSESLGFVNLNDLLSPEQQGVRLLRVDDITDSGLVVGLAIVSDGSTSLFTLQIPAPASSLALGGLAALGLRRRRQAV